LPGITAQIASKEALVVMKAIAGRPKDLNDILELLKMNPDVDRKYVESTVTEFAEALEAPEILTVLKGLFGEVKAPGNV